MCTGGEGSLTLLVALPQLRSVEAKFFALQQTLRQLSEQEPRRREQALEWLLSVMRLRPWSAVCRADGALFKEAASACSESAAAAANGTQCQRQGSGDAQTPASSGVSSAAAETPPFLSGEASAVHNKLAVLVVRLLAQQTREANSPASAAAALRPLRRLMHESLTQLARRLSLEGFGDAVLGAQTIARRCANCAGEDNCVGDAATESLEATLETLLVCLRVLAVFREEFLQEGERTTCAVSVAKIQREETPRLCRLFVSTPSSVALFSGVQEVLAFKNNFPGDCVEERCPPAFSPMVLELLQLVQLVQQQAGSKTASAASCAASALFPRVCEVAEGFVGWLDLLLAEGGTLEAGESRRVNLVELLGNAWKTSGSPRAAEALAAFIARKMEAGARIDLLCSMRVRGRGFLYT